MPDCGRDADNVDDKYWRQSKFPRHNRKRLIGKVSNGLIIQSRNEAEAEVEHMKCNEEEENDAGDSLDCIEPITRVRVKQVIGTRVCRDHKAIDRVID